jgi:exonuclease SbcC
MNRLTNISINNIRRFGENVNIPIEKGATIFLAPNGTGKTSLFEAIELALTGKVNRLSEGSLNALIREGQQNASVNLKFNNGLYCSASMSLGQSPIMKGDHKSIFKDQIFDNLPYLLRLTHLLDQQSSNWLVQFKGDKAGSQLEHLAIGREAIKADAVMTSAKRAATERIQFASKTYDTSVRTYSEWNALLLRKQSIKVVNDEKLKSLNELSNQLNAIANRHTSIGAETTVELSNLISLGAKIREVLRTLADSFILRLNRIIVLEGDYQKFENLKKDQNALVSQVNALKSEISFIHEKITIEQKSLINELDVVASLQGDLSIREDAKRQFDANQLTRKETESFALTVKYKKQELLELRRDLDYLIVKISLSKSAYDRRLLLESQMIDMEKIITDLNQKRELVQRWHSLKNSTSLLELELAKLRDNTINLREDASRLTDSIDTHRTLLKEISAGFTQIISSQDKIREAVILISSNLSDNASNCPVCLSEFEPSELKSKIDVAIAEIDPNITSVKQSMKTGQALIDRLANDERRIQVEINRSFARERHLVAEIEKNNSEVNRSIRPMFHASSPDLALSALENHFKSSVDKKRALNAETEKLVLTDGLQVIHVLESQASTLEASIKSLEVQITTFESRIEYNLKGIESYSKLKIPADWISNQEINELRTRIQNYKSSVEHKRNLKEVTQQRLNSLIDAIGAKDRELALIDVQIKTIKTNWEELKLYEVNDLTRLNEIAVIRGTIGNIAATNVELTEVAGELYSWKENEKYFEVDEEIKQTLNGRSEIDQSKDLFEKQQQAFDALESLRAKNNVLQTFSDKLSTELNFIHEKVKSINPYWKKLLKRIVVDPRFYETELDSFSRFRKQHATISVNLHGDSTMVRNVASEAQLTDLQLTFMMSMATKYQWSSWKGLLLDDPIQHHDLVHASGVFDLLRDYIIDFDYQLLMATHDESQARYFLRKLINDGVPAKLCILRPTDNGVTVVQE